MKKVSIVQQTKFSKEFPNPKIVFIQGPPGCGKKTICNRLIEETGKTLISVPQILQIETEKGTIEGNKIIESKKAKQPVPAELVVDLIIKQCLSKPDDFYFIEGFPRTIEEALYFEQNIAEIRNIIHFQVSEDKIEDLAKRILKSQKELAKSHQISENQIMQELQNYMADISNVLQFYDQFNLVRNIDCIGTVGEVLQRIKQAMKPEVFMVIGPKGTGKSTVCKQMTQKYNLKHIQLEDFQYYTDKQGLRVKVEDQNELTKRLINMMIGDNYYSRFVIEDYPINLYQFKQFQNTLTIPKFVFYLNCDKDVAQQRLIQDYNRMAFQDQAKVRQTSITLLYNQFYNQAQTMLLEFQKLGIIHLIDANKCSNTTYRQIQRIMEPIIAVARGLQAERVQRVLYSRFGYKPIQVERLLKTIIERKTDLGKKIVQLSQQGKIIPSDLKAQLMRSVIYNGKHEGNKFLLTEDFPKRLTEFEDFEKTCSRISLVFHCCDSKSEVISSEDLIFRSLETEIFQQQRLFRLQIAEEETDENIQEQINQCFEPKKGKYVVISGPTNTGKTVIGNYLQSQFKYTLVNYTDLPEVIKTKKSTEEEPYENVTLEDIVEELNFQLNNQNTTLVFDQLPEIGLVITEEPPEGTDKTELYVQTVIEKLYTKLGVPYAFLQLECREEVQDARMKEKLGLGPEDEYTEEHKAPIVESTHIHQFLCQWAQNLQVKTSRIDPDLLVKPVYQINTDIFEQTTLSIVKSIFQYKLVLIRGDSQTIEQDVSNVMSNIAFNHNLFYIDVKQIFSYFQENEKHPFAREIKLGLQVGEIPFHITYPLIQEYLMANLPARNQLIIITGMPKMDRNVYAFPRVMDQLFTIEKAVGKIVALIQVIEGDQEPFEFEDLPVAHTPEPKKQEKGEGQEEEGQEEQQQEEQEEEDGQKTKVEVKLERSAPKEPLAPCALFNMLKFPKPEADVQERQQQGWKVKLYESIKKVLFYFKEGEYYSQDQGVREWTYNIQILA